jgi:exosome complex component RRP41
MLILTRRKNQGKKRKREKAMASFSSKMEFISPEGLRVDGRRPNELRRINCRIGVLKRAHGSAYYEQGNTKVLASVFGPMEARRGKGQHDRAIVHCEYSMAPFSTGERKAVTKGNRRAQEISLALKQTFEEAILVNQFPGSAINIFVQVLQADGGTRCASVNAITLALISAGIPMQDFVVGCSAGYVDNTPLLDLNYLEDSARGVDLPLAIFPKSEKVVMLQMDYRADIETVDKVMALAILGCQRIYAVLVEEVRMYHASLS